MPSLEEWSSIGLLIDAASGILYIVLGIFIAFVRPRSRSSIGFAVLSVGLGLAIAFSNLWGRNPEIKAFLTLALLTMPIAVVGAIALVRAITRKPLRRLRWSLGITTFLAFLTFTDAWYGGATGARSYSPVGWLWIVGVQVTVAALWFIALALAEAYPAANDDLGRQQLLGMGVAFLPWLAWLGGTSIWYAATGHPLLVDTGGRGYQLAWTGTGIGIAVMWLRAALMVRNDKVPARIALAVLVVMAISALVAAYVDSEFIADVGVGGVLRTLGFLVIAHGIVRLHMLDIDVKLKWTVQRGTVATIFIATFFVVSVVAENFLTEQYGWAIGGIGAGLLLFGIAPLQRMSERLANATMPNVKPLAQRDEAERLDMYAAMVQQAWADGNLSRTEGRLLDVARERLGMTLEQANTIQAKIRG